MSPSHLQIPCNCSLRASVFLPVFKFLNHYYCSPRKEGRSLFNRECVPKAQNDCHLRKLSCAGSPCNSCYGIFNRQCLSNRPVYCSAILMVLCRLQGLRQIVNGGNCLLAIFFPRPKTLIIFKNRFKSSKLFHFGLK